MITKHYSTPWTLLRFEKRGVSLLYNEKTRKYEIYKHISKTSAKTKAINPAESVVKLTPAMIAVLILASALGMSIAFNIINIIL